MLAKLKTPTLPLPKKMNGKTLSVGIVIDPMGVLDKTPEDEIEDIKKDFDLWLAPFKPVYTVYDSGMYEIKAGTDLIVFDFGGMSIGNSMMEHNSIEVIKWCQDNPSSLVAVISDYTYRNGLIPELSDLGLSALHNLISIQDEVRKNYKAYNASEDDITPIPAWFFEGR